MQEQTADNQNEAQIGVWLKEATPEAAAHLRDLAETTNNKEIRKSARRALYRLSQSGIVPDRPAETGVPVIDSQPTEKPLRAFASAFDGAGNRLFLLLLPAPEGGSFLTAQILANDELGIRDLGLKRHSQREIVALLKQMEDQLETGLAIAEIEPDYARWLISNYREINRHRVSRTPSGFLDLVPRIGEPKQEYTSPPIYANLSEEEVRLNQEIPHDPAEFFKLRWFEPWFFAVEEVVPWLERWEQAENSVVVFAENIKQDRKRSIVKEAAGKLMPPDIRQRYISRLEESADVLRRRDKSKEAAITFYQALELKEERPVEEVPFAQAIVQRTIEAAMEMVRSARKQQAEAAGHSQPADSDSR